MFLIFAVFLFFFYVFIAVNTIIIIACIVQYWLNSPNGSGLHNY